jgi:hypothetical protein
MKSYGCAGYVQVGWLVRAVVLVAFPVTKLADFVGMLMENAVSFYGEV